MANQCMYCFVVVSFQINLATRDKAIAPTVNYPVYLKRPGSASVTLTTPSARLVSTTEYLNLRRKLTSNLTCHQRQYHIPRQLTKKQRPVSADCNSKCVRPKTAPNLRNQPSINFNEQLHDKNSHQHKVN